jgi:hypothetical protein
MNLKLRNFRFIFFSALFFMISLAFAFFEKLKYPYCGFACFSRWVQIISLLSLMLLIIAVLRLFLRGAIGFMGRNKSKRSTIEN